MAQWLGIFLPMQGTQVRFLVWEDPTCHRAAKPVCRNYWACAWEPPSHNYWAHAPQLLKPMHARAHVLQLMSPRTATTEACVLWGPHAATTEPTCCNYWSLCAYNPCCTTREATAMRSPCTTTKSSPHSLQLEKACAQQQRPSTAKTKKEKEKEITAISFSQIQFYVCNLFSFLAAWRRLQDPSSQTRDLPRGPQ